MLTPRQNELLVFIQNYALANGYAPTFSEMAEAINVASKSNIHRLVSALEERGFIRRLQKRQRAIEIIRMPEPPKEQN